MARVDLRYYRLNNPDNGLEILDLLLHGGDVAWATSDGVEVKGDAAANLYAQGNEAGGRAGDGEWIGHLGKI